jgi:hypothetical protein
MSKSDIFLSSNIEKCSPTRTEYDIDRSITPVNDDVLEKVSTTSTATTDKYDPEIGGLDTIKKSPKSKYVNHFAYKAVFNLC